MWRTLRREKQPDRPEGWKTGILHPRKSDASERARQPAHENDQEARRPFQARRCRGQVHSGGNQDRSYNKCEQEEDRFGGNLAHNELYYYRKNQLCIVAS